MNNIPARATTLQFTYLKEKAPLIMVPVEINGKGPYDFILDTGNGAASLLLCPDLAEELSIRRGETAHEGFTVDIANSMHEIRVGSCRIGELEFTDIDAGSAGAITELASRLGIPIHGNIGYPLLKGFALTLDFDRMTLTLDERPEAVGGVAIEVDPEKPLIMIDALANGRPMRFLVDTGASGCCLSRTAAEELELELGEAMALNHADTPNSHISELKSLTAGGRTRENVRVIVADFFDPLQEATGMKIDGVLGHNFWSHYRMTIDYPGKRLIFEDRQ